MKKLIYCAAALVTALFAGSCQRELLDPAQDGSTVTFTVNVPEVATKGFDDGRKVIDDLVYAVYKTTKETEAEAFADYANYKFVYQVNPTEKTGFTTDGKTSVELELINDQNYVILFWAQNFEADAYDTEDLRDVKYAKEVTKNYVANKGEYAAFSGAAFIKKVKGASTQNVTLNRPFAQINIATADPKNYNVMIGSTAVTVRGAGAGFNVANQQATSGGDDYTVVFAENGMPDDETLVVNGNTYYTNVVNQKDVADKHHYIAMNYVFATDAVDIDYTINTDFGTVKGTVPSAPVAKNYRTNIVGDLLTSDVKYNVTLDKGWDGDDIVYSLWDGESIEEPSATTVTIDGTEKEAYVIDNGANLAWLAAAVNGTLPGTRSTVAADSFAGKTFILTKDVNLDGNEWTPVGTEVNPFKGTFDGNGYTIHNLVVNGEGKSNQGLFGYTTDGEIKNVTVENAKVSGRLNVGVVAGTPYTSKYTNITVKGHVEVNGMAYVGGVGGKNAYADWTNVTVNVDETSYVKANSVENGTAYRTYVGGVVGFNGEGGHTFKNITSNIDVKGSTIDVGGMFGIAHYGNKFENCVCTGNVEIYAAEDADEAEQIGGIAGVWHNETGYQVKFTNCNYNGTLKVNVEDVNLSDNTLVGAQYSATGTGVLVVDGKNFYGDLASINAALAKGEYVGLYCDVTAAAASSNGYGATGVQIHNGGTLDGNGHTLTITGAGTTWDSAISIKGGEVKNLTVAGAMRGIFMPGANADVYIENVTFKNVIYTFNSDAGNINFGVYLSNCTINGWTSHSNVHKEVVYTACSFGQGSGYKYCRPYGPTTYINCEFCEGFEIEPESTATIKFENCTLNGVAVTADNYTALVIANHKNVSWPVVVETVDALNKALGAGNDQTIVIAGNISDATIKLPTTLENVTLKGANGYTLKNVTISAADGNSYNYKNLTFDGLTFDNSRIVLTGWRNGEEVIENLTVTNCTFQNLYDNTNEACVHINKEAAEAVNGFTFTNNVINGATGGQKSGIYAQVTGEITITNNVFNDIVFRPAIVQLADCDGTEDKVNISNNVISNTTRLQVYGTEEGPSNGPWTPVGTDKLTLSITYNIFKNISSQYICTWGINGTTDISRNYYDKSPVGKIYWNNETPNTETGLSKIGIYPIFNELNSDGTINTDSLVEAPTQE